MGKGIGASGYRGVRKHYQAWKAVLPDETVLGVYSTPLDAAIVRERFLHNHRDEFNQPERYLNHVDLSPGVTINTYKKPKKQPKPTRKPRYGKYIYRNRHHQSFFVRIGDYQSRCFAFQHLAILHRDEYLKKIGKML
ncbi:hypothetical protein ELBI_32 [Anabaena phage Elbi]|nr:hypothetical protein ELBI_32 [Anabaena phage Elbi]